MHGPHEENRTAGTAWRDCPLLLVLLLVLAGCQGLDWSMLAFNTALPRSQNPSSDEGQGSRDTLVGGYVSVSGLHLVTIEGVGLVTGLDGTGGDPPPSEHRGQLLKDMQKRGVPNPRQLLQSPSTAMVIVRAYLPPMIRAARPPASTVAG